MLSLALVIVFVYLVAIYEPLPFRDIVFEVVSAFGTVGLSCGITAQMHVPGKLLITLLMFAGRLGPLTIVLAFPDISVKLIIPMPKKGLWPGKQQRTQDGRGKKEAKA